NLKELMQLWGLGAPVTNTVEGFAGWEVKRTAAPALVRWVEAGQWLVLCIGQNDLAASGEAARRIRTGGRPIAAASNYWLRCELNLPRLREALDLPPAITGRHELAKARADANRLANQPERGLVEGAALHHGLFAGDEFSGDRVCDRRTVSAGAAELSAARQVALGTRRQFEPDLLRL